MNFCMASTQSKKEKEGKERKKRKTILGQTTLNHHTRASQKGKEHRDKSNNMLELRFQPLEQAACTVRMRRSD